MNSHIQRLLPPFTTALLFFTACSTPHVDLQSGDRIIFLGDSITMQGDQPGGYVTIVRDTLTARHPDLGLEIIGAGISGNKVPNLQDRLHRDVLSKEPTIVFIYIGINDVWHSLKPQGGTPRNRYETGLRSILSRITGSGARAVLCTPSVIGERYDGANSLDTMLDEYSTASRQVARELEIPLLDLRKAFIRYLRNHNPDNLEKGILTYDGVHLNEAGNRLVAGEVLWTLGERGIK
ncbi:MAG: SGNH/GDSL hydrolase family protein [Fidelibacterota bacterium]|nr:MAG: SGNH/GDSL hydrolase family protein [Candidatus Neomarinimicrobiota bacterium]